jgi:hypothetical protein
MDILQCYVTEEQVHTNTYSSLPMQTHAMWMWYEEAAHILPTTERAWWWMDVQSIVHPRTSTSPCYTARMDVL